MRYLFIIISFLAVNANAQTSFDKVMEEYNEAFTSTNNEDSVNAIWDAKIDAAQIVFDAEIEAEFKADIAVLEAEQKASEDEIKKLESEVEPIKDTVEIQDTVIVDVIDTPTKESDLLIKFREYYDQGLTAKQIYPKFTEVELILIGAELGYKWTTAGSKLTKAEAIIEKIK